MEKKLKNKLFLIKEDSLIGIAKKIVNRIEKELRKKLKMTTEEDVLELEKQLKAMEIEDANSQKVGQLKKRINQFNFRKKHKKLFKLTMGLGEGTRRIFKGIGSGVKKARGKIAQMDEHIAKQEAKERKLNKGKTIKKRSMLEEAGDID